MTSFNDQSHEAIDHEVERGDFNRLVLKQGGGMMVRPHRVDTAFQSLEPESVGLPC